MRPDVPDDPAHISGLPEVSEMSNDDWVANLPLARSAICCCVTPVTKLAENFSDAPPELIRDMLKRMLVAKLEFEIMADILDTGHQRLVAALVDAHRCDPRGGDEYEVR
jgi:hypothetical protein